MAFHRASPDQQAEDGASLCRSYPLCRQRKAVDGDGQVTFLGDIIKINNHRIGIAQLSTIEMFENESLCKYYNNKLSEGYLLSNTNDNRILSDGLIESCDALSNAFYEKDILQMVINNKRIAIIMIENPPYIDGTSNSKHSDGAVKKVNDTVIDMDKNKMGKSSNDSCNQFIWSALRKIKPDVYIIYSPLKYWSIDGLMSNYSYDYENACIFNRSFFHASESSISVISWYKNNLGIKGLKNADKEINFKAYNIKDNNSKVIFTSTDEALQKYPELFKKYFN